MISLVESMVIRLTKLNIEIYIYLMQNIPHIMC